MWEYMNESMGLALCGEHRPSDTGNEMKSAP
jgi:hypothetical protein